MDDVLTASYSISLYALEHHQNLYMKRILTAVSLLYGQTCFTQITICRDPVIANMVQQVSADSLRSYIKTLVGFGTRNTLSTQSDTKRGIGAARQWVLKKLNDFGKASNGRLTAYIDTTTLQPDGKRVDVPVVLGNVVAIFKGTDTADHRFFLVSGHLDNMRSNVMDRTGDAPGANDDGSGVAAVLECARIMSKKTFGASVIFIAVSGEEQGLLGANFMSEKSNQNNINIEAVLNNDIMGSNNSNETNIINNTQVRVFSEGLPAFETEKNAVSIRSFGLENDGKARQLARYVKEVGERYVDNLEVIMIYRNDRFLRGGDHTPFVQRGFSAVRITEMNENYTRQHQDVRVENNIQYGDLPEHIDYDYLRKNSALNLSVLSNLASAPGTPDSVKIDVKNLSNSTLLSWQKPLFGKADGYYVLVRETTSPVWQKKYFIKELNMRLPFSKDNYFFAVQSANKEGNESLPVTPSVSR